MTSHFQVSVHQHSRTQTDTEQADDNCNEIGAPIFETSKAYQRLVSPSRIAPLHSSSRTLMSSRLVQFGFLFFFSLSSQQPLNRLPQRHPIMTERLLLLSRRHKILFQPQYTELVPSPVIALIHAPLITQIPLIQVREHTVTTASRTRTRFNEFPTFCQYRENRAVTARAPACTPACAPSACLPL